MTRTETAAVAVAVVAVCLAAAHAPAFGQFVVVGEEASKPVVKEVPAEAKGPKGKAAPGKGPRAEAVARKGEKPPEPKEPTFTADGGFESTKEKARESALRAAVDKLHDHLQRQDPPVDRMPTPELVRKMLLADQEKVSEQPVEVEGKTETMYRVTVAVRVEPDHVRELRSRERSSEALWVLAGLGGLAALGAVFFRVDAWTKGYLTNWLVLGAVGTGSLLAGLWWMAK